MRHRGEAPGMTINSSHWGVFEPIVADGRVVAVRSFAPDPDPSPIIRSIRGCSTILEKSYAQYDTPLVLQPHSLS